MLKFSEKVIGKIEVPQEIKETDIENIIVSSFEGGSNYWMGIDNSKPEFKNKPKDEPLSTWATKIILEGGIIQFYDIEDEEETWTLTLDKLLNSIKLNAINRSFDSDLENMDATTADCIIQYALFGEVVYG